MVGIYYLKFMLIIKHLLHNSESILLFSITFYEGDIGFSRSKIVLLSSNIEKNYPKNIELTKG